MSGSFRELRQDSDFFDVTLGCCGSDDDDGLGGIRTLQAHKVVLSASSPFFRQLLRTTSAMASAVYSNNNNPFVYLRGVRLADLEAVLDFVYHGEVNLAQKDLDSFLAVAEDLKIKGLSKQQQIVGGKRGFKRGRATITRLPSASVKRPRVLVKDDNIVIEVGKLKKEPPGEGGGPSTSTATTTTTAPSAASSSNASPTKSVVVVDSEDPVGIGGVGDVGFNVGGGGETLDEDYDLYGGEDDDQENDGQMGEDADASKDLDDAIEALLIHEDDGVYRCKECDMSHRHKQVIKRHVEAKHIVTPGFECESCAKMFKTRRGLKDHWRSQHRKRE